MCAQCRTQISVLGLAIPTLAHTACACTVPRTSRVPRGHALHTVPLSSWRLRSASSPPLARVTAWGGERRGAASVTEGARLPSTPFRQSRLVALGSRALRVVGHGEPLLQLRVRLLDDGCAGRARESGGAGHARASASAPRDRGAAARAGEQGGRTMPRSARRISWTHRSCRPSCSTCPDPP